MPVDYDDLTVECDYRFASRPGDAFASDHFCCVIGAHNEHRCCCGATTLRTPAEARPRDGGDGVRPSSGAPD